MSIFSSLAAVARPFISSIVKGGIRAAPQLIKGASRFRGALLKGAGFLGRGLGAASRITQKGLDVANTAQQGIDLAINAGLISIETSKFERGLGKGIQRGAKFKRNIDTAAGKVRTGESAINRFNPMSGFQF